jgi:DNA-binding NarL/FixJ family response regulator
MDAQMPGMDGVEATRRIKTRLPSIKILFLVVHMPYVDGALAAGADAFLMKDCGRRELLQAIRELAGRD